MQKTEDNQLTPVTGIVDVLDNYAFVRTSGYLAGANDVYVSMAQIKRYGLRRGDAVTGLRSCQATSLSTSAVDSSHGTRRRVEKSGSRSKSP